MRESEIEKRGCECEVHCRKVLRAGARYRARPCRPTHSEARTLLLWRENIARAIEHALHVTQCNV